MVYIRVAVESRENFQLRQGKRTLPMKKLSAAVAILGSLGLCMAIWAADWPSQGGNPQRDGWAKGEQKLSKESGQAGKIQLLYNYKFDNKISGPTDLTSPIVLTNIIGYMGFKQLVFIGGSSDTVYSIDADLGRPYFKTPLGYKADAPPAAPASSLLCPGGLTATVAIPGTSSAGRGFGPPGAAAPARVGRVARTTAPTTFSRGGGGFGGPGSLYALGSDGYLRNLRQEDGNPDATPPVKFLPPNARPTGLNVNNGMVYVSTVNECGGNPNGIYAVKTADGAVASLMTGGTGASGTGGTAIGTDGVVYAQIASGQGDVAGKYNDTVVSLNKDTLAVQDYFTPSEALPDIAKGISYANVTPAVFGYKDKDWIVTGGRDGRIYILDADSLGGSDHHIPLYRSDVVVAPASKFAGNGIWNSFATSLDADGATRWLYVSIHGPAAMKFPTANGAAPNGSIIAFKIVTANDKPSLDPQWSSADLISPEAPITANGLVFALSTGQPSRLAKADGSAYTVAEWEKLAKPASLHVLDGSSGKQLFTSGPTATYSPSGLAVANAQIYFSTHENVLHVYGIPLEK
jgi:hypothetical protein